MSTTVEVWAMVFGEIFSTYYGIEDSGKLFLKKDSWKVGPECCVLDSRLTKIAENSASIYRPDTIRKVNLQDIEYSSHPLPANDPHCAEIEAYSRRRQEILDNLPTA